MSRRLVYAIGSLLLVCLCIGGLLGAGAWLWFYARPQPGEARQELFQGVVYLREVRRSPRPMVIHVVIVDLRDPQVRVLVTPGDPQAEKALKARTTSGFLQEYGLQLAVNGGGFTPWRSNSIFDYYPHVGDPVDPLGFAASQGKVYGLGNNADATLYISRSNRARFQTPDGGIYNAISGTPMLIAQGRILPDLTQAEGGDLPQPRTAVALDKNARHLIIVVVDGRQPRYSEGATLEELAEILLAHGGFFGMNLDGGGSSTLVMQASNGRPRLLNSPIDLHIPGRERAVGNHLGIYAARSKK